MTERLNKAIALFVALVHATVHVQASFGLTLEDICSAAKFTSNRTLNRSSQLHLLV